MDRPPSRKAPATYVYACMTDCLGVHASGRACPAMGVLPLYPCLHACLCICFRLCCRRAHGHRAPPTERDCGPQDRARAHGRRDAVLAGARPSRGRALRRALIPLRSKAPGPSGEPGGRCPPISGLRKVRAERRKESWHEGCWTPSSVLAAPVAADGPTPHKGPPPSDATPPGPARSAEGHRRPPIRPLRS